MKPKSRKVDSRLWIARNTWQAKRGSPSTYEGFVAFRVVGLLANWDRGIRTTQESATTVVPYLGPPVERLE